MTKLHVLLVAGTSPAADGTTGGQVTAASNLLRSAIRDRVQFTTISSTMRRVPPPPIPVRAFDAANRTLRFIAFLKRTDVVLIFVAGGMSLIEKGLLCQMARLLGRGVVVRFSSGTLPDDIRRLPFLAWWLRKTLRAVDVVVVQGEHWKRFFRNYANDACDIRVIPNGIAVRRDRPSPERNDNKLKIVYIGQLLIEKGILDLVRSFAAVVRQTPQTELIIAGGGDRDLVLREASRLGVASSIRMLGWLTHESAQELLGACDLFVLPSHAEGLPNAMLEAMAVGLPVVVTAVGSIPEVVVDGFNGRVVLPGDTQALTEAMLRLLLNPSERHKIGEMAKRTISDGPFNVEHVWPLYLAALEQAASEARWRSRETR